MTKFTLLGLITAFTMAIAGGNIIPIEVPQPQLIPVAKTSPFYAGASYTYLDVSNFDVDTYDFKKDSALTVIGGYEYNKYIGAEGRLTTNFSNSESFGYGIYIKPQYPVTDKVKVYALLGYAGAQVKGKNVTDGFGYGAGVSYNVTPRVFLFGDYVALNDTNIKTDVGNANVGIAYRF